MNVINLLQTAYRALTANKMRSALTVLGIIIGVAAVITLTGIGTGTQTAISSNIESMGSNLLFVRPGATQSSGIMGAQGSSTSLTLKDAEALVDAEKAPAVKAVAPQVQTMAQVVAGSENTRTFIYGVTPDYETVRNAPVAEGSFITTQQVNSSSMVAVLGSSVATTLFPDGDPIGQNIKINGKQFKVIGVLKSKGGTGFGSADDQILAPLTTVRYRLATTRTTSGGVSVSTINVEVVSANEIDAATTQVQAILEERHNISDPTKDDFSITSQEDTISTLKSTTQVFVIFLGAIAGISLLVGGIGIMNIMLVSVTERTREIGIRKAVGAKRKDILLQFLVESALLCLLGGAIGVLISFTITKLMPNINFSGQSIKLVMSGNITILAVSVSVAIGIIFGLYPAYRAARLKPIEALHYE